MAFVDVANRRDRFCHKWQLRLPKARKDDDDLPFNKHVQQLTANLKSQFAESVKSANTILKNLVSLGVTGMESP